MKKPKKRPYYTGLVLDILPRNSGRAWHWIWRRISRADYIYKQSQFERVRVNGRETTRRK